MDKSFGLFFFLKKPKGFISGKIPICVRVTIDGESFELCSKRKRVPTRWSPESGRMIGKGDEVKSFNVYFDTLQQKVFEAKRKLIEMDKPLTCESLKGSLVDKDTTPKYMILEILTKHNEQIEAPCGYYPKDGSWKKRWHGCPTSGDSAGILKSQCSCPKPCCSRLPSS